MAIRARARAGEELVGTFVKLGALESIDLVAQAGFDFALIDLEHSQLGFSDASRLIRHASALGLPAAVRLPAVDAALVNRLLEAGAAGIQLSSVTTLAQADALRRACGYPPHGRRSASGAQPAAGYGMRPLGEYLAREASSPPLVIGQIETATTDDPLDAIVARLDLAFLGTTDLAVDLGVLGEPEHPLLAARLAEVARAAAGARIPLGAWAAGPGAIPPLRALGARYLVIGSDLQFLEQAIAPVAAASRAAGREQGR